MGAAIAVTRFDPTAAAALPTYAVPYIRQTCQTWLLGRAQTGLRYGEEATPRKRDVDGKPPKRQRHSYSLQWQRATLRSRTITDRDGEQDDFLTTCPAADESKSAPRRCEGVQELLTKLRPIEARVLELHYYEGKSFPEVGREMGLNRNRVRQLQVRALEKLRKLAPASLGA
jgi:RNA polymerase sigma factor (sigma-70 family)